VAKSEQIRTKNPKHQYLVEEYWGHAVGHIFL